MKNVLNTYINQHGGTARLALHSLVRSAIDSDFVRKVAETFATRILLIGISLISGVIIARILGPSGRGIYAVAATVATIGIQFGNMGLHASNTYYIARNRTLLPSLFGNTLFVSFVLGTAGAIIAWIFFFFLPHLAPVRGIMLTMALVWIPLGLAYLLLQNIFIGINEVRAYNKIELVTQSIGVVLILLVILVKAVRVETVYFMGILTVLIGLIWAVSQIRLHLTEPPSLSLSLFKDSLRYGVKAYFAALFAFLVLRIDLLMIQSFLGADQTGYYAIAVSMADMLLLLPVIIGMILFPKLSALPQQEDKWRTAKKAAIGTAILLIALAACAAVLAKPAVLLLFGRQFAPSIQAFIWLLPGIVFMSINVIFMNYFASIGMPPITIYSPAVALICNVLLNFKLIPLFGIVGASLASVFSYGLMLGGSVLYISRMKRDPS